ncbi:MAG: multidrug resistance efflux transporter family protein [Moraxella sp.]|nr:multidrug resistance efflux transporter family protein [Moraxella sp.]
MPKLIFFGLIAGFFFSSTFVLNEVMAMAGGQWFWSASGRYVFMWLILSIVILLKNGVGVFCGLIKLYQQHLPFWSVAGGVGFGGFYAFLCFGADHAPAWVIAATFQFTVVASLIVMKCFGETISPKAIIASLVVFFGVLLANVGEGLHGGNTHGLGTLLLFGALPALVAGFCFPIGNQLVWYATHPKAMSHAANSNPNSNANSNSTPTSAFITHIPHITSPLMASPLHKVWLLTTGSLPAWLVLGVVLHPAPPSVSQVVNTFLVALFAGVIATSIFIYARTKAANSGQLAGIDATQASEVIFAMIGGMLLLGTPMPSTLSLVGIGLVVLGLVGFAMVG